MNLDKKVVVITGGAGLLGEKFTRAIVKDGGIAIIADLNVEKSKIIIRELNKEKVVAYHYPLDITKESSVKDMIMHFDEKGITINAVVNNAYPKTKDFGKDFFDVTYETFCENMNMHIGGYFNVSKVMATYFKEKGQGNIINIASIYGMMAPRFDIYEDTKMTNGPEYAAIKSSIIHLTKFMANRFKGMNIRVNCVAPGGIFDNQPKPFLENYKSYCSNKGMLDPEDLTGSVVFLLSDYSRFVQGQLITVDDGFSI